jgi:hypothetical protein
VHTFIGGLVVWFALGLSQPVRAQPAVEGVGTVTAVQGTVTVTHEGSPASDPLRLRQALLPGDMLHTEVQARAKAMFQDDTMLVVAGQTTVILAEYLHDPDLQVRRMTLALSEGTVRALVGRAFAGVGSLFTLKAGGATVMAHAAYCVVWNTGQETGVANIGRTGAVSFTSGGRVVMVEPGQAAVAQTGRAPGPPKPLAREKTSRAGRAVADTELQDDLSSTLPNMAVQELEDELVACPPGSPPGGVCPRKAPAAAVSPATPPAVTSGAKRR